ncbi:MAG: hypothetical protein IJN90_03215 [Bacilli bacterium]|nr:hypothetical protein [Bacilli bacterium]
MNNNYNNNGNGGYVYNYYNESNHSSNTNYNNTSYSNTTITTSYQQEIKKTANKVNIIAYIGLIIIMIGTFLDFATMSITYEGSVMQSATVNYFVTEGEPKDGIFVFFLAISAMAMIYKNKNMRAMITSLIAGGIVLMDYQSMPETIAEIESEFSFYFSYGFKVEYAYGPALYFCIAGFAILLIYFIAYFKSIGNTNTVTISASNQPTSYNPQMKYASADQYQNQPQNNQNINYNQQPTYGTNQNYMDNGYYNPPNNINNF